MAKVITDNQHYSNIAAAIRTKNETDALYKPSEMAPAILAIQGGVELNFEVVGGTTQPSNPKENTIWVDTITEITGWVFDASEPSGVDGLVWIKTDEKSPTIIDALNENSIILRPIEAKQYVSDSWISADLYVCMDGEWIQLNDVPPEYQKVEYLQSSGTQYFDTGFVQNVNSGFEIIYEFLQSNSHSWIFGVAGSGDYYFGITEGHNFYVGQKNGSPAYKNSFGYNVKVKASFDSSILTVNSVQTAGISRKQVSTTTPVSLYAIRLNDSYVNPSKAKIYSAKFTANGELIRDFVPCYRKSDSVAGMYDRVTKAFFTNVGTGTFTVGGDVE